MPTVCGRAGCGALSGHRSRKRRAQRVADNLARMIADNDYFSISEPSAARRSCACSLLRACRDSYKMASQTEGPSWGWVSQGFTTLAETWMFSRVARRLDQSCFPGRCRRVVCQRPGGHHFRSGGPGSGPHRHRSPFRRGTRLGSGFHDSVRGEIRSEWRRCGGCVTLKVTIPANTTADIRSAERSSLRCPAAFTNLLSDTSGRNKSGRLSKSLPLLLFQVCSQEILILESEHLGRNLAQRSGILADAGLDLDEVDVFEVGGAAVRIYGVGDSEIVFALVAVGNLSRGLVVACVVGVSPVVGAVEVIARDRMARRLGGQPRAVERTSWRRSIPGVALLCVAAVPFSTFARIATVVFPLDVRAGALRR